MKHDLHFTSYTVDPEFWDDNVFAVREIMAALRRMCAKWLPTGKTTLVLQQLADYKNKVGTFGDKAVHDDARKMNPVTFWQVHGSGTPELQDLAIKALSVDTSIMDVEKANSILKSIWNDGNALMTPERACKLLTVRYNRTALKEATAKPAPTLFYRDVEPAIRKQDLDQMENGVEVQVRES